MSRSKALSHWIPPKKGTKKGQKGQDQTVRDTKRGTSKKLKQATPVPRPIKSPGKSLSIKDMKKKGFDRSQNLKAKSQIHPRRKNIPDMSTAKDEYAENQKQLRRMINSRTV